MRAVLLAVSMIAAPLLLSPLPQSADIPQLSTKDCPAAYAEAGAACFTLTVHQDRAEPELGTLDLNVAVIPAASDTPAPDPLLFIPGGPGGGAVGRSPGRWLSDPMRAERAIVLMDPRGTGQSQPLDMSCPEAGPAFLQEVTVLPQERGATTFQDEAYATCRARLNEQGIYLDNFTIAALIADYEDLREALGYEVWNLHGLSFGTNVALSYMRDHPEALRSAILELPAGPEQSYQDGFVGFARTFEKVFDLCAADPACAAAYPDLRADFYRLLNPGAEPAFTVPITAAGERLNAHISTYDVFFGLASLLYSPTGAEALPMLITEVANGNQEVVQAFGQAFLVNEQVDTSFLMSSAIICTDAIWYGLPPRPFKADFDITPYPIEDDITLVERTAARCETLGAAPATPAITQPAAVDVPALFLAGSIDPTTTPEDAYEAAANLPNATVAVFEGYGHSVATACAADLRTEFITDPLEPPSTACTADVAATLDFVTPAELYETSMMFHLESKVLRGTQPAAIAALALTVIVMVMEVPLFALWLLRRERDLPTRAVVGRAAGLLAALAVAIFFAGVGRIVAGALAGGGYTLVVGLPVEAAPLFALPWVVLLLTPLLMVVVVRAWREGWFSGIMRLHMTALAAAALTFAGLALSWDMLLGL